MNHPRVPVRFAFAAIIVVLISSCASVPAAPGQQAYLAPTDTPAPPAPLLAQSPAASESPTPDATVQEEVARVAPPLPSATASPPPARLPPTVTPQPQPTAPRPEPTAALPLTLQDEIFLAGAPMFAIMFTCDQLPPEVSLPAVTWQQAEGIGQLCLYGFAEGEEVRYEIYDSEGDAVEAGATQSTTFDSPQPAAAVVLTLGSYPPGQWVIRAASTTVNMQETFEVAQPEGPPLVAMRLSPGQEAIKGGRGLADLAGGDEIQIYAVHLPPDAEIPVGVYYAAEEDYVESTLTLHEQAIMPTDEAGTLSIRLQLDPSYTPGFYCVVLPATTDYVPERGPGEGGATECFTIGPE